MDDIISKKYPEMNIIRKDTEQEKFEALRLPLFQGHAGCKATLTNLGTFQLFQGNIDVNDDCSLSSEKRVVQNLPSGFATGVDTGTLCTSLVSYVMNIHLTEMFADGTIASAWDNHISRMATINCTEKVAEANKNRPIDEDENFSLRLEEMGGIFIMHLALTIIAILLAFVDLQKRLALKRSQSKRSTRNRETVCSQEEKQYPREMDPTENCTYMQNENVIQPVYEN